MSSSSTRNYNNENDDIYSDVVIFTQESTQSQRDVIDLISSEDDEPEDDVANIHQPHTPPLPPPPTPPSLPPLLPTSSDNITAPTHHDMTIVFDSETSTETEMLPDSTLWIVKPWRQEQPLLFWSDGMFGELEIHQHHLASTIHVRDDASHRVLVSPFNPMMALHVLGIPAFVLDIPTQGAPGTMRLWQQLCDNQHIIRVMMDNDDLTSNATHDIWLAATHTVTHNNNNNNNANDDDEEQSPRLIAYAVPKKTSFNLLSTYRLALVLGIENTLLRYYDMETNSPPRESELAMLQEFHMSSRISLPGGVIVHAEMQESIDGPVGEKHPVVTLTSPQGTVVLTKVDNKSYIVHIRPGWSQLRSYICAGTTSSSSSSPGKQLFRLHPVAKEARGSLALELWRILDPNFIVIPRDRVVSVLTYLPSPTPSNPVPLHHPMDITRALGEDHVGDLKMTICVDNSARWSGADLVWPVRAYDPYLTPLDSVLAAVLQVIHDLRNDFFHACDHALRPVQRWISQFGWTTPPPNIPNTMTLLTTLKHRWLQEFQAAYGRTVPEELAKARDFFDPVLRNKYHLIVDTNVFLITVLDNFDLFTTLQHVHEDKIVVVVPSATLQELDWQKHHAAKDGTNTNGNKSDKAQKCIKYINSFAGANSKWLVLQSADEDAALTAKRKAPVVAGAYNTQNDARILDCAKLRHDAGLKTMLVTGDVNLRNLAMSSNIAAVRSQSLWRLVCDMNLQRLAPEYWLTAIAKIEQSRAAHSGEMLIAGGDKKRVKDGGSA